MFDLEQAVAKWRQQMLAAGIKTPVPLEELESHLREAVEQQMESGLNGQEAFDSAARQIGQANTLKSEFKKVGGTIQERIKHLIFAFSGLPNLQLATNMNTSNSNLEPGWATYLKTVAFVLPAICIWLVSCVIVVPKLKELCAMSGMPLSQQVVAALAFTCLFKEYFLLATIAILSALALLEWRSNWWARHRRLIFWTAVFLLNLVVLIVMFAMVIVAVSAGVNLSHPLPHGR